MEKTSIIVVTKSGELKQMDVFHLESGNLFKKAGFKKSDDFLKQHTWKCNINEKMVYVSLYAKTKGKANSENKYDFPPPMDTQLFFGNCVLVAENDSTFVSLTKDLWLVIYSTIFGGFEDLKDTAETDEIEEDELQYIDESLKSSGYLKDGFVVSDEEIDNEMLNYDSELEEESYVES
jgi:hypothetical protein